MSDYLDKAFWQISGAVISGAVGLTVFWFKRRWDAKDHFAITVSQIAGEFKRPCIPLDFYDATFDRIEEAVHRLRPFVSKSQAACLSDVWSVYCSARSELQKSETERHADAFNSECLRLDMPLPKGKREIISFFHRKLSEAGK